MPIKNEGNYYGETAPKVSSLAGAGGYEHRRAKGFDLIRGKGCVAAGRSAMTLSPFAQRPFSDHDEVGRVAQRDLCDRAGFDDLQVSSCGVGVFPQREGEK